MHCCHEVWLRGYTEVERAELAQELVLVRNSMARAFTVCSMYSLL